VNDPETLWRALVLLVSIVTGIIAWLGKRHIDRLDSLDREAVRHHDLKELEERLTEDRKTMHEENQRRFAEVREDIRSVNNSIERVLYHRGGSER